MTAKECVGVSDYKPFVLSDRLLSVCLIWIDGCRLKGALCIPVVPLHVIRFVSVSSVDILSENVTGMLRCVPRHVRGPTATTMLRTACHISVRYLSMYI